MDTTRSSLAALLNDKQADIVSSWTESLQKLPNARYPLIPHKNVHSWATRALDAVCRSLDPSAQTEQDSHLKVLVRDFIEADYKISDVLETFLIAKEAILPHLQGAIPPRSPEFLQVTTELDSCLRHLVSRLGQLYSETSQQLIYEDTDVKLAESESLHRTTSALLEKLTLDEVLEIVCSEAQLLTGATGSAVLLLEEEGWLRVTIATGTPQPVLKRMAVTDSLVGLALGSGRPYWTNEPQNQVQDYRNSKLESLLVIPLQVEKVNIGALDVVNKPGGFTENDVRILSLFAHQAAMAIKNARLHHQAEKLAVVEERQRLARELHDSVTQSLYSVALFTDAVRMALEARKIEKAEEHLQDLRHMAREAMLDMRLLIFELHPPELQREGLVQAVRTRLEAVEARSGIETVLEVVGDHRLPIEVEMELYRITQEALTNVVKHARAQQIFVNIQFTGPRFCLEVRDNGVGFDPDTIDRRGGMGLQGIRERVQHFNGDLVVESNPGQGTRLQVCLEI